MTVTSESRVLCYVRERQNITENKNEKRSTLAAAVAKDK